MVPQARNPHFTGREAALAAIHATLQQTGAAGMTQAITGLGGVGKSQTALEYAYRRRSDYRFVLWVSADSAETLSRDYGEIARRLGLAPADATADEVREAVRTWLAERTEYLLILDNADNPRIAAPFLPAPPAAAGGHVLVTSRARSLQPLGAARPIALPVLPEEEAVAFLLARAGREDRAEERARASSLAEALGALPLALEQAGAYIAAQEIGFDDYLELYRRQGLGLLERTTPEWGATARTVQKTWQVSFRAVRAASPAAADLLTASAFFAPDQIPYELLILGASELGKPLAAALAGSDEDPTRLWELLSVPANYSLLQRDPETQCCSVHRLVQEVMRAPKPKGPSKPGLTTAQRRAWAARAVRALNRAFPGVELAAWPWCERLLPHALAAAAWIKAEEMAFPEAARLLNQTGGYLQERGQYATAEPLYQRALSIREQALGLTHPDTATSLNNLASLYLTQGKLGEADPLFHRALAIREHALGPAHPDTATSLNNLAQLYQTQGKLTEAEPLFQRALAIDEAAYDGEYPKVAADRSNLALLYQAQGKLSEAESLFQRALSIREHALGPAHPDTAASLNNLAGLYQAQGKLHQAGPLYQRALTSFEQALGPQHPHSVTSLNNLASLYRAQGKLAEAEPLFQRALSIQEQALGPLHPQTVLSAFALADVWRELGREGEAGALEAAMVERLNAALGAADPAVRGHAEQMLAALLAQVAPPAG